MLKEIIRTDDLYYSKISTKAYIYDVKKHKKLIIIGNNIWIKKSYFKYLINKLLIIN